MSALSSRCCCSGREAVRLLSSRHFGISSSSSRRGGNVGITIRCGGVSSFHRSEVRFGNSNRIAACSFHRDAAVFGIHRGGASSPPPISDAPDADGPVVRRQPGKARQYTQQVAGTLFSAVGFVLSSATSLVTNRKQFGEWKRCLEGLDVYLKDSGIEKEISFLINRRLLGNLIILSRIQATALRDRDTRDLVRLRGPFQRPQMPSQEEAARYMKFATSAYGESMIRAAEMHSKGKFDVDYAPLPRQRIANHVGLPEEDIVATDLEDSGDSNHLRHFVAVDHGNRNVVLSIRGTFNLGELVVDVAGFARPFMGGEAHSEMATMAERVWEQAGDTVRKLLLESGKDYGLVITGHSLGAGTACLLNILLHQDRRRHVHGRRVRCFAYASPPVFSPLGAAPREAIHSTTNYIHERDTVPFLSVNSIRHFFSCIGVIDERTKKMSFLERQKLVTGYAAPDESLCKGVVRASLGRLPQKTGAPLLAVPAATNIWIRERDDTTSGEYDARDCDSIRLAKKGITVDQNMLFDHFPTRYEHALDSLSGLKSR